MWQVAGRGRASHPCGVLNSAEVDTIWRPNLEDIVDIVETVDPARLSGARLRGFTETGARL